MLTYVPARPKKPTLYPAKSRTRYSWALASKGLRECCVPIGSAGYLTAFESTHGKVVWSEISVSRASPKSKSYPLSQSGFRIEERGSQTVVAVAGDVYA